MRRLPAVLALLFRAVLAGVVVVPIRPRNHGSPFHNGDGPGSERRGVEWAEELQDRLIEQDPDAVVVYPRLSVSVTSPWQPMLVKERSYYWDGYYRAEEGKLKQPFKEIPGKQMCMITFDDVISVSSKGTPPVEGLSTFFMRVEMSDETEPPNIVWSCNLATERCCGVECCSTGISWKQILAFISLGSTFLLIVSVIVLTAYLFLRAQTKKKQKGRRRVSAKGKPENGVHTMKILDEEPPPRRPTTISIQEHRPNPNPYVSIVSFDPSEEYHPHHSD